MSLTWLARLRHGDAGQRLDTLLAGAEAGSPLPERMEWLEQLASWLRRGPAPGSTDILPHGRLRFLLQVLDRNTDARDRVGAALRSLVRDSSALDLFCNTGLPHTHGFWSEARERLAARVLPAPPYSGDLGELVARVFRREDDATWIEQIDDATAERLAVVLQSGASGDDALWPTLAADLENALLYLTTHVRATGLTPGVRACLDVVGFRNLPFFGLTAAADAVIAAFHETDASGLPAALNHLRLLLDKCDALVESAFNHLDEHGVNLALVYRLSLMQEQIRRAETVLDLLADPHPGTSFPKLLGRLIRDNTGRHSVRNLAARNLGLLSRKIAESNAETGDHYIARTGAALRTLFRQALGGGGILSITTVVKLVALHLPLAPFVMGLAASLNYAISFVAIQLLHFTVATKQPASTAAALSDTLGRARTDAGLVEFTEEAGHLIRSQWVAVAGNLLMVTPCVLLLDALRHLVTGTHFLSPAESLREAEHLSLLGATPLYAAFTGILLWLSSLFAGFALNWFNYRRLRDALGTNRTLILVLGPTRARQLGAFLQRNISGLAGNVSLGFLLGMVPVFAAFVGLPLEVRHVTLVTGALAVACAGAGPDFLATSAFWLALLGMLACGVLNIAVSFGLALTVAVRARDIRGPDRRAVYRALVAHVVRHPLSLFVPPRT